MKAPGWGNASDSLKPTWPLATMSPCALATAGRLERGETPKGLPLQTLAPLGCGIQTGAGAVLNCLKPKAGESIAVFGVGAVGLSAIMAAKIAGCQRIGAVARLGGRRGVPPALGG